jgi:anti-anti-sigma factor
MKTEIFLARGRLLVRIKGRFVLDECDAIKEVVQAAMTPAVSHVLVDLAKTEFVDSAGLGTLVGIKFKANKIKARMTLLNPSSAVEEILTMSKLSDIFEIASGQEADTLSSNVGLPENLLRTLGGAPETAAPSVQSAESLKIEEAEPRKGGADAAEMVEELCRNAVEALRRGSYEESIRYYRRALEINGDYLPARNNLAIVYEKRPEWRQSALEQWEIVLRLSDQLGDSKHKERAEKHLKALRE